MNRFTDFLFVKIKGTISIQSSDTRPYTNYTENPLRCHQELILYNNCELTYDGQLDSLQIRQHTLSFFKEMWARLSSVPRSPRYCTLSNCDSAITCVVPPLRPHADDAVHWGPVFPVHRVVMVGWLRIGMVGWLWIGVVQFVGSKRSRDTYNQNDWGNSRLHLWHYRHINANNVMCHSLFWGEMTLF